MAVRGEWVGYGLPAAEALRGAISASKNGGALAPVTVVVPTNHVGVAVRRLLASGRTGRVCSRGEGLAAVSFLTVYRLGELLGAAALSGQGRRPVSTPVLAAALRAALHSSPGIFGPVASHPSTEMSLVAAYRELRDLSESALGAVSRQSPRAADVVRLAREARARLSASWYDEEDLLEAAGAELARSPARAAELGSVVVYLPERVSRHGAALLAAVAEDRDLLVISGSTGDAKADAEVALSVRRIGGGAAGPAPDAATDPLAVVDAARTRIVTASDADEEVRAAVRAVMRAVRSGVPLDRMAILFADPKPYARLVFEQLAGAGVVMNGTAVMPLTARVPARTLLGLLALPQGGFRRDAVFAWLAGARLLHQRRWVPVGAWERISREAGVVAGRADWDARLALLAEESDAEADLAERDPETPPWRVDQARARADRARALRGFVLGQIDDLAAASETKRTWPQWAHWAGARLRSLVGDERTLADWPPVEQRAMEKVELALDRLGCLGEVEGAVGLDVFTRTLELELDSDLGRIGRMGQGLFVGPVSMGVGLDLDLVVVVGLAEGVFPSPTRQDSLLPDSERSAAGDELALRSWLVERRHREFLAALAGATHQVLCVPRGDLRGGRERIPSRWVLQVAGALAGATWHSEDLNDPDTGTSPWLEHVASFDSGLRAVTTPATDQEYRLRSRLASSSPGRASATDGLHDELFSAGAEVVAARRSPDFTRFDGNLSGIRVPSPAHQVVSATRLEGWADCPFAYLVREVLKVQEVENPEEELTITPLDRGSLVHFALEDFVAEVLARPTDEQPAPTEPWTEDDRQRMLAIAERHCGQFQARGLTGRPIFWAREKRRVMAELLRVLELDSEHRAATATRPVAAELSFGFGDSAIATIPIELPDGRAVSFRGRADRVDLAEDGTVHVVDYKTGKSEAYNHLSADDPVLGGTRLQLPVYGQAARALRRDPEAAVRAEYWFISSKGQFKRIGYQVTREVLAEVGDILGALVHGIESGVFPHHPTATSSSPRVDCPYCDPDGLGVTELRRAYQRKRSDSQMAPYTELLGPEGADV